MSRGNGFRVHKVPNANATPLTYMAPTSEVLAFGQILCQGSTMGGSVGTAGTTNVEKQKFIGFRATTGATTELIPCLKIQNGQFYELIAPVASSETVISTTNVGNYIAFSSSGTCLCPATTGFFVISKVFNTSGVTAQYLTGHFVLAAATTA